MKTVFIGTPSAYLAHEFESKTETACQAMKRILDATSVEFLCNAYGKIVNGDVYEVVFEDENTMLVSLLKTGLMVIPNEDIELFRERKRNRYKHMTGGRSESK